MAVLREDPVAVAVAEIRVMVGAMAAALLAADQVSAGPALVRVVIAKSLAGLANNPSSASGSIREDNEASVTAAEVFQWVGKDPIAELL